MFDDEEHQTTQRGLRSSDSRGSSGVRRKLVSNATAETPAKKWVTSVGDLIANDRYRRNNWEKVKARRR